MMVLAICLTKSWDALTPKETVRVDQALASNSRPKKPDKRLRYPTHGDSDACVARDLSNGKFVVGQSGNQAAGRVTGKDNGQKSRNGGRTGVAAVDRLGITTTLSVTMIANDCVSVAGPGRDL